MSKAKFDNTLELSEEEMRSLGYRTVDVLVEHFQSLGEKPVTRRADRIELDKRLREPPPEEGADLSEVLERLEREVFANIMHVDHPRFFAFVPSPSNFVSVVADTLASGFNAFCGAWLEGSGPAEVELVTLDWLRRICDLPEGAGGLFVSGGSVATLTALAVARRTKLEDQIEGAVVYCSDQTHSSVARGLTVLGFAPEQLRRLLSNDGFRLEPGILESAISDDRSAGRRPFCVIANAGTTNTGAVDPLDELAPLCSKEGLWLHADGAYGAAAALCEKGRRLLRGLGSVDSLSLDPHKWLFQPYEMGCVLVRDERLLERTFRVSPEYLKDAEAREGEVNFFDRGVQLTRGFRALKLWMSLQVFGLRAFREAVEHGFDLAEKTEEALRRSPRWVVVSPAQMGIINFRYVPEQRMPEAEVDALNGRMVEAMISDGYAMVSTTTLRGRTALRMCTINPRMTETDVRKTIRRLEGFAEGL